MASFCLFFLFCLLLKLPLNDAFVAVRRFDSNNIPFQQRSLKSSRRIQFQSFASSSSSSSLTSNEESIINPPKHHSESCIKDHDDLYLGIDCGTQGLKALVYNAKTRQVLGVDSVEYGLNEVSDKERIGKCAEQNPKVWCDAMYQAANSALDKATHNLFGAEIEAINKTTVLGETSQKVNNARAYIRGIGVSGQQHGMVCLDQQHQVIRPAKLWCDSESSGEAEELSVKLNRNIVAAYTISKLLWLKRNEPSNFKKMGHLALPHDYLNLILTGKLVMECGDASGTGLLDSETRDWDQEAVESVDNSLRQKLPPLIKPYQSAGKLLEDAGLKLGGVPSGIPVSAGSGDNMMSALGCGCTSPGRVVISLGTSGTIFTQTLKPPKVKRSRGEVLSSAAPFLDSLGRGLPLACIQNCASIPEEVRKGYGLSREEITKLAENEPAGCEGLSFVPFLKGERTPNWPHASGALVGIREGHLQRPGLLYRAALEGVALSLRNGIESSFSHDLLVQVGLVGGGSGSQLWRQIISDVLGVKVVGFKVAHSAALGAAIQAAAHVALDVKGAVHDDNAMGNWIQEKHDVEHDWMVLPNIEHKETYDAAFESYQSRSKKLFEKK